jgi:Domain of unknown function (DUF4389)
MEYPASIEVRTPDELARWRPFVQWILAIPHLIIAGALGYVAGAVAIIAWFVILFTGKLPDGIANLQMMIIRYTARAYVYAGYLHDEYPPFDFTLAANEPGGTPVDIAFEPALADRNRLTVGLRFIWIIPAALFAFVIWIVGVFVWMIAALAVLFTGRWPTGLLDWAGKCLRVWLRLEMYGSLLTDEYPPFNTD